MASEEKCFQLECQSYPQYVCECPVRALMCQEHISFHIDNHQGLPHAPKRRYMKFNRSWQQTLMNIKNRFREAKTNLLQQLQSQTLQKIIKIQFQLQKKMLKYNQNFDQIFAEIEKALESSPHVTYERSMILLKKSQKPIKKICKWVLNDQTLEKCFFFYQKYLYHIDYQNRQVDVAQKFQKFDKQVLTIPHCHNIQNQRIVLFSQKEGSQDLLIDYSKQQKNLIKDIPTGNRINSGQLKYQNSILVFGGKKFQCQNPHKIYRNKQDYYWKSQGLTNECWKLDLENMIWQRMPSLPKESANNSAIKIGQKILVTGQGLNAIYYISPGNRRFEKLIDLGSGLKILLKSSKKECICLHDNNGIFVASFQDISNWKKVGEYKDNMRRINEPLQLHGKIYYLDSGLHLVTFDTKTYTIEKEKIDFDFFEF